MLRRAVLRMALRWRPADAGVDVLARLPDATLDALRRDGMDPRLDGSAGPVRRVALPWGFRGWLVTGYDEVRSVLADHDAYSNDFGNLVGRRRASAASDPGGLGFADPPEHTRLRQMLTPHFTARRLRGLEPAVARIVDDAVADAERGLAADGSVDLVQRFALPVPSLTICELLGVPYAERDQFQRLSRARFDVSGGGADSLSVIAESLDYLEDLVARRRREPAAGLIGGLLAEHGAELTDRELAGVADGLLTGGLETTESSLALGVVVLLRSPEDRTRLAADPAFAAPYVDDLLRYLTVVQVAFPRFARRDLELAGMRVRRGDVVLCSLSVADRDPRMGAHPDRVDTSVDRPSHLAFGHGIHRCVGAELARLELRLALPELFRRIPDLRLTGSESDLEYRPLSLVYGLAALPVHRPSVLNV